jgi:hypothetical protein
MREFTRQSMTSGKKFNIQDVDPQTLTAIQRWINSDVSADMGQTRRAAQAYAGHQRDSALIDYNKQYGVDRMVNLNRPYHMWPTRMMAKWAQAMIDQPAWMSMWARMEKDRKRFEDQYVPNRLKGKVKIPAPWLPKWAGGGMYIDPQSRIFQFEGMANSLQYWAESRNYLAYDANRILGEMVDRGEISAAQQAEAYETRQGELWEQAMALAESESGTELNPMSMANMMLTPAMWWTAPQSLMKGQPEEIGFNTDVARVTSSAACGQGHYV